MFPISWVVEPLEFAVARLEAAAGQSPDQNVRRVTRLVKAMEGVTMEYSKMAAVHQAETRKLIQDCELDSRIEGLVGRVQQQGPTQSLESIKQAWGQFSTALGLVCRA